MKLFTSALFILTLYLDPTSSFVFEPARFTRSNVAKTRDEKNMELEPGRHYNSLADWIHGSSYKIGNVSPEATRAIIESLKSMKNPESPKYPRIKVYDYTFGSSSREVLVYIDPDEGKQWIVNIEDLDMRQNLIIFELGDLGFGFRKDNTYIVLRKSMLKQDPFHYIHLAYIEERKGLDNIEWDNLRPKDLLPIPMVFNEPIEEHKEHCKPRPCGLKEWIFGTCAIVSLSCHDVTPLNINKHDKERISALIREKQPFIYELARSLAINKVYWKHITKSISEGKRKPRESRRKRETRQHSGKNQVGVAHADATIRKVREQKEHAKPHAIYIAEVHETGEAPVRNSRSSINGAVHNLDNSAAIQANERVVVAPIMESSAPRLLRNVEANKDEKAVDKSNETSLIKESVNTNTSLIESTTESSNSEHLTKDGSIIPSNLTENEQYSLSNNKSQHRITSNPHESLPDFPQPPVISPQPPALPLQPPALPPQPPALPPQPPALPPQPPALPPQPPALPPQPPTLPPQLQALPPQPPALPPQPPALPPQPPTLPPQLQALPPQPPAISPQPPVFSPQPPAIPPPLQDIPPAISPQSSESKPERQTGSLVGENDSNEYKRIYSNENTPDDSDEEYATPSSFDKTLQDLADHEIELLPPNQNESYFEHVLKKIRNGPPFKYTARPFECVGCGIETNHYTDYEEDTNVSPVVYNVIADIFQNSPTDQLFSPEAHEMLQEHPYVPYVGYGNCDFSIDVLSKSPLSIELDDIIDYYGETLAVNCADKGCESQRARTRIRELLTSKYHMLEIWTDMSIRFNKSSSLPNGPLLSTNEFRQFMISLIFSAYTSEYRLEILGHVDTDLPDLPNPNQSPRMKFITRVILRTLDLIIKNFPDHLIKCSRYLLQILEDKYLALVVEHFGIMEFNFRGNDKERDVYRVMNSNDRLQTLALKDFIINGVAPVLRSGTESLAAFGTFFLRNRKRIVNALLAYGVDSRGKINQQGTLEERVLEFIRDMDLFGKTGDEMIDIIIDDDTPPIKDLQTELEEADMDDKKDLPSVKT